MGTATSTQSTTIITRLKNAVNDGKLSYKDDKAVLFNDKHLVIAQNKNGLIYLTCVTKNGKVIHSQKPIAQKMSQGSWGSMLTSRPRRAGGWRYDNTYYQMFAKQVRRAMGVKNA